MGKKLGRQKMKKIMQWILITIYISLYAQCAQKTLWHGQYIDIKYTGYPPKEDFKVSNYIVVAYNILSVDKNSHVVYRFEIMINGKKEGAVELCDRSVAEGLFVPDEKFKYFLIAGDSRDIERSTQSFLLRKVHKMYETIPDYEILKQDVVEILSGR